MLHRLLPVELSIHHVLPTFICRHPLRHLPRIQGDQAMATDIRGVPNLVHQSHLNGRQFIRNRHLEGESVLEAQRYVEVLREVRMEPNIHPGHRPE